MPIRLRFARNADLEAIGALMALSIERLQQGFLSLEQIGASHQVMGLDTQLIADGTYAVALDGDMLVGCGGWSRRATLYGGDHSLDLRDPVLLDPMRDSARIRAMYTHPAQARRGIGRAVLAFCEAAAAAEGFGAAELMSTVSGEPLYQACGYIAVEPVAAQVGEVTVPLIRMRKKLRG